MNGILQSLKAREGSKARETEKKKESVTDLLNDIGDVSNKDKEAIGKTTVEQTEFVAAHALAAADHDDKMQLLADADFVFHNFDNDKSKADETKKVETTPTNKEDLHVSFETPAAKPVAAAASSSSSLSLHIKQTTVAKPTASSKPVAPKPSTKNVVNNNAAAKPPVPGKPVTSAKPPVTAASAKSATKSVSKPAPVPTATNHKRLHATDDVDADDDDDDNNEKDLQKKQKLMSEKELIMTAFSSLTDIKSQFDSKYNDVTQKVMFILNMFNDIQAPSAGKHSTNNNAVARNNNNASTKNNKDNVAKQGNNKQHSSATPREEPKNNNAKPKESVQEDEEEEDVDLTNDKQVIRDFDSINIVVNHLLVNEEANIFIGMDADVIALILSKVVSLLCPKKSGLIIFDKLGSFKQGLDNEELQLVHNLEMVAVFLHKFAEKEYPAIFKELTVPSSLSKFNIVMKFYQSFRDSAASQKTKDSFCSQVFPSGAWSVRDARLIATFVYFLLANVICKESKIELYASKVDLKLATPVPLLGSSANMFGNYKRVVNKKPEHKQPDSKQVEPNKPVAKKQQQPPAEDDQGAEEKAEEADEENNHHLPEYDEEEQDDEPEDHSIKTGDSYKKFLEEEREKYLMMQKRQN